MNALTQLAYGSGYRGDGQMMLGSGSGYNDGMSWLGALMMLLVWAGIIGLIIYVVRTLTNNARATSAHRDPLEIAKERFAKGEITKEQLTEIKKELK